MTPPSPELYRENSSTFISDVASIPPKEKWCNTCKTSQPIENFGKRSNTKNTLRSRCFCCERDYAKKWRANHLEYKRAKTREWGKENQKHRNQVTQVWRKANPDKTKNINDKAAKQWKRIDNHERAWISQAMRRCRNRAKDKHLSFNMVPSDLHTEMGHLPIFCPIFPHIRLDYFAGPDRRYWPSVDKIVPQLGYISGNVWIISMAANTWKTNGSNSEERKRIVEIMNKTRKISTFSTLNGQGELFET